MIVLVRTLDESPDLIGPASVNALDFDLNAHGILGYTAAAHRLSYMNNSGVIVYISVEDTELRLQIIDHGPWGP